MGQEDTIVTTSYIVTNAIVTFVTFLHDHSDQAALAEKYSSTY
jgi:hypothetical protein